MEKNPGGEWTHEEHRSHDVTSAPTLGFSVLGEGFELVPNGLIIKGTPSEEQYDEAFRRLKVIEDATAWWYGDLALGRERHYGSLRQMAEKLEVNYSSLQTYQNVAGSYELCNRLHTLSFKHHMIAASLEDRLEWLKEAEDKEWSATRLQQEIRKVQTRQKRLVLPSGKFNVIYADPPWQYDNAIKSWGPADLHYQTLPLDAISRYVDPAGRAIQDVFAEDATLFLWATNPFLHDALHVVDSWGFDYKTNMVWVKTNLKRPGSGFYVRGRHELLLICSRGSFVPDQTGHKPVGSVIPDDVVWADVQEHSRKPEGVYPLIEKLYPRSGNGYRHLELFARNTRPGWESWGAEVVS